eukprot:tig00001155_g7321.t1
MLRSIQVAINLVGNSTKFSEEGRVIMEIEAEGAPGEDGRTLFRITVTDTGAGIAEADQRRLFTFFTQLDSTKSRRHRGTGLGLFISLHIAQGLGGGMEVLSTPGTGSTFAFTFRAAVVEAADPLLPLLHKTAVLEGDAVLRGKTFIVAVDEPVWAGTIAVDAERWGMRVVEVRSIEGAIAAVRGEVGAGRGGDIGGLLLYMPSTVPKEKTGDAVELLCGELERAKGPGDLAPAPFMPLRIHVPLAPWARRENVYSLRLPIAEQNLHDCLVQGFRARRDASVPRTIPTAAAGSCSEAEIMRRADTLAPAFDELEEPLRSALSGSAEAAPQPCLPRPAPHPQPADAATRGELEPAAAAAARGALRILFAEDTPARLPALPLQPAAGPPPPSPRSHDRGARRRTRRS